MTYNQANKAQTLGLVLSLCPRMGRLNWAAVSLRLGLLSSLNRVEHCTHTRAHLFRNFLPIIAVSWVSF